MRKAKTYTSRDVLSYTTHIIWHFRYNHLLIHSFVFPTSLYKQSHEHVNCNHENIQTKKKEKKLSYFNMPYLILIIIIISVKL